MAWPHDVILGGQNRTRVTYDQLSLTQFAQGFIKNVLEEKSEKIREKMLSYLTKAFKRMFQLLFWTCNSTNVLYSRYLQQVSGALRYFMGVTKYRANLFVQGDSGCLSPAYIFRLALLKYWNRLCKLDNSFICKQIFNYEIDNLKKNTHGYLILNKFWCH